MSKSSIVRMEGKVFGNLTVLSRASSIEKHAAWLCQCTCGKQIIWIGKKLRAGRKKSCNIDGHRFVPEYEPGLKRVFPIEYRAWRNMRQRCNNTKNRAFDRYGGRGINICERWNKFENFILDMGRKPRSDLSLERLDNNGHYEPGNCVWETQKEQRRNKRNTIEVMYQGKTWRLTDLVESLGLSRAVVVGRLKSGWPLDVALAIPVRRKK